MDALLLDAAPFVLGTVLFASLAWGLHVVRDRRGWGETKARRVFFVLCAASSYFYLFSGAVVREGVDVIDGRTTLADAAVRTAFALAPIAVLVFVVGPIGYLVYRLVRYVDREDARAAAEREAVRRVGRPDHPAPAGQAGGAA